MWSCMLGSVSNFLRDNPESPIEEVSKLGLSKYVKLILNKFFILLNHASVMAIEQPNLILLVSNQRLLLFEHL